MVRLTSRFRVQALIRRVHDAGGSAMIRARGDDMAGAVLVVAAERGAAWHCLERGLDARGREALIRTGPDQASEPDLERYWQRRRLNDPDLWVVEVDVAGAERFAAETILSG